MAVFKGLQSCKHSLPVKLYCKKYLCLGLDVSTTPPIVATCTILHSTITVVFMSYQREVDIFMIFSDTFYWSVLMTVNGVRISLTLYLYTHWFDNWYILF